MAIILDAKFATRVRVLELNSFHIDVLDNLVPQLGACGMHLDPFDAHCMRRSAPFGSAQAAPIENIENQ
jgi:hypothetical protein